MAGGPSWHFNQLVLGRMDRVLGRQWYINAPSHWPLKASKKDSGSLVELHGTGKVSVNTEYIIPQLNSSARQRQVSLSYESLGLMHVR